MDTLLQQYLNQLKSSVNEMAGLVEETIVVSTKALAKKDPESLSRVFELEDQINEFHKKIDRDCFKLLARQSPVASDLRLLIVSTKMGMDLERMGDLACSISYCISDYLNYRPVPVASEIPKMADLVRIMVRKGLDAFLQNDEEAAREVLVMDDSVDNYRDTLSQSIRNSLRESHLNTDSYMELYTIVRNLERIGDHATNIAEEAIFLISGEDVRHKKYKMNDLSPGRSE
jgi:phosphate transport system protein